MIVAIAFEANVGMLISTTRTSNSQFYMCQFSTKPNLDNEKLNNQWVSSFHRLTAMDRRIHDGKGGLYPWSDLLVGASASPRLSDVMGVVSSWMAMAG